jgi:hypothetical protein
MHKPTRVTVVEDGHRVKYEIDEFGEPRCVSYLRRESDGRLHLTDHGKSFVMKVVPIMAVVTLAGVYILSTVHTGMMSSPPLNCPMPIPGPGGPEIPVGC